MQKTQWVQKILDIPPAERIKKFDKKLNIPPYIKRTQQYYLKKQKRLQSSSQLIQKCNINKIYTVKQLLEYNRNNKDKISWTSILYWFGSWGIFKRRLIPVTSKHLKYRQNQIIDLCVRFHVNSMKDFESCHEKQPQLFPSYDWVSRHFGSWKYFKRVLQACSVQQTLQKYIDLKIKLKRYPSKNECRQNNVQVDLLLTVWKPQQFKQTVQLLERIYKHAIE